MIIRSSIHIKRHDKFINELTPINGSKIKLEIRRQQAEIDILKKLKELERKWPQE